MTRPLRLDPGELCYHVINRGNGRPRVFRKAGVLSRFMQRVTTCHVRRYHGHCHGSGRVLQGRFKAIVAQGGAHLLPVLRHVERNPVREGLAPRAKNWPWASARFGLDERPFQGRGVLVRHKPGVLPWAG